MDPVAANDLQITAIVVDTDAVVNVSYLDLAPPQGDATPQTHAWASLTG